MKPNEIIIRKVATNQFTITTTDDGKTREGFNSISDTAEWVGTMKAHGLFKGLCTWYESPKGRQPIEPTYKNPCSEPIICRAIK